MELIGTNIIDMPLDSLYTNQFESSYYDDAVRLLSRSVRALHREQVLGCHDTYAEAYFYKPEDDEPFNTLTLELCDGNTYERLLDVMRGELQDGENGEYVYATLAVWRRGFATLYNLAAR